jgi:hypothetical protein
MFETPEHRSLEVDHNRRSRRDAWRSIYNSGYGVLQRKKVLECFKLSNTEVSKWIIVVNREGMCGARFVTLGMDYFRREKVFEVFKTSERGSPEVDHSPRSRGMPGTRYITLGTEYFREKRIWRIQNSRMSKSRSESGSSRSLMTRDVGL